MTPNRLAPLLAATLLIAAPAPPARGQDRPLALKGAAIETVAEAGRIDRGVVVLRGGTIEAVGLIGEVEIPEDAFVVDAAGRTIMPGIVEPAFSPRGAGGGATRTVIIGDQVVTVGGSSPTRTPSFTRAADLFDPYRSDFAPLLRSGLTHLDLVPPDYGRAAVVRVTPEEPESMVVERDGCLYVSVSNATPSLEVVRRGLESARRAGSGGRGSADRGQGQGQAQGRPGGGPQATSDPSRELWREVVEGKAPLIVDAANAAAILYLLDALGEFDEVKLALIASGRDAYLTIDRLADRGAVTMVLRPSIDTKPENRDRINVPRIVHERGIGLAFTQGGGRSALRSGQDAPLFEVGYLIATGLPRGAALEALTRRPAELIGLGDSLGSIEPGKSASLLVFDGDPFDPYGRLCTVIIEGRTVYETD